MSGFVSATAALVADDRAAPARRPVRTKHIASATAAWERGLAGGPDSRLWLERAARLAPDDPRVRLDLARLHLAAGEAARAAIGFAAIAAQHDAAAAWLGLAMARDRLGDAPGAAAALGVLLSRHRLPAGAGFAWIARRLAARAGYGGFCGVLADGAPIIQGAGRLLGAPADPAALARVTGIVAASGTGLTGWASRPAAPDAPPALTLSDAVGRTRAVALAKFLPPDAHAPFLRRYTFTIAAGKLRGLTPPFTLRGPDGAPLPGSPLDPAGFAGARAVPAARRGAAPSVTPPARGLAMIVPVFRGFVQTKACLQSLLGVAGADRVIVVDDATPDAALAAHLDELAAQGRIILRRHQANRGFCHAVNTGLQAAGAGDVLLLNSDTIVPPGAIRALRRVAYARPDTGTVTPFSNEGAILSYPQAQGGNPMPDAAGAAALQALAARANEGRSIEIPTGIGFCLYIRHDCLAATGALRAGMFAQGYGEENDFCLRARQLGFAHRAALGAYVAHAGGVSFGADAPPLLARNLAVLERLYPGYHALVQRFIRADRLAPARARMDTRRLLAAPGAERVLLITHSHGGGVARQVAAAAAAHRSQGRQALVLTTGCPGDPEITPYPWPSRLVDPGDAASCANLTFTLPRDITSLLRLLRRLKIAWVERHHTLGHHPAVHDIAAGLNVPQHIILHDYGSFCPRLNLLTGTSPARYCGEPDAAHCAACCAADPAGVFEVLAAPALRARSAAALAQAAAVIVPSEDAARRITRNFPGITPRVTPWEDDGAPRRLRPPRQGHRRIVVIGGIGMAKGFGVLRACGRDAAARGLDLTFIVAGSTADDARLLRTGRIMITGAYGEAEAESLTTSLDGDLAFFPSIWPETWCFTLGTAWRAGLYSAAFDIGAPAERIRASGRGFLLPPRLPAARINDALLTWTPNAAEKLITISI